MSTGDIPDPVDITPESAAAVVDITTDPSKKVNKAHVKTIDFGGLDDEMSMKVSMSHKLYEIQKEVSQQHTFELYRHMFFECFMDYPGVKNAFKTNEETYNHYFNYFQRYYAKRGGWINKMAPNDVKKLHCHMSWVLEKDTCGWSRGEITTSVEKYFHRKLFEYLRKKFLFGEEYYVHEWKNNLYHGRSLYKYDVPIRHV